MKGRPFGISDSLPLLSTHRLPSSKRTPKHSLCVGTAKTGLRPRSSAMRRHFPRSFERAPPPVFLSFTSYSFHSPLAAQKNIPLKSCWKGRGHATWRPCLTFSCVRIFSFPFFFFSLFPFLSFSQVTTCFLWKESSSFFFFSIPYP